MKDKIFNLEEEVKRKKKVLYLDYEECKNAIKPFLADFMVDDYEPGHKLREEIDKS